MEYIPQVSTPSELNLKIAQSMEFSDKQQKNKGRRQRV